MQYANNKGADQPAHPRSLIGAFIVHCLDSKNSLHLASVTVQAGLSLAWSEPPNTGFLVMWLILLLSVCMYV